MDEEQKLRSLIKGMRDRSDQIFETDEKTAILLRQAATKLQMMKKLYIETR